MLRAPPVKLYFCEHFYFLTVKCLSRWAAPPTRWSWDIFSQSYQIWKVVRSVFASDLLFTHLLELVLLAVALSSLDWPVRGSWFGLEQRCSLTRTRTNETRVSVYLHGVRTKHWNVPHNKHSYELSSFCIVVVGIRRVLISLHTHTHTRTHAYAYTV